ncbi:MAG TPA: amidohydrolase family protein [Polyangiaceae bacterium]|nr:amidohydrolase family protein [Polyangiaceae bacterium]
MPLSRVDAHVHFWRYTPEEYPWLDEPLRALRRDFLPADLEPELKARGVSGVVAVQARQSLLETEWLLELQQQSSSVLGVVGWVDLRTDDVSSVLGRFPSLCGVRHIAQGEAPGFLLNREFSRGIAALTARDLAYDLLIYENQLSEAAELVDRHPQQRFVLDHLAKPRIAARELSSWASALRRLAQRPNVWLKISGLVTEADWATWTPNDLEPYLNVALEAFGPERAMCGSDHPVCLAAASYERVQAVVSSFIARLTESEQAQILAQNAISFYKLRPR